MRRSQVSLQMSEWSHIDFANATVSCEQMNENKAPYRYQVLYLTRQPLSWCTYYRNITHLSTTLKRNRMLSLWQIVPYFGLLFTCFEMCKQLCLYRNGYIVSPLSYKLTPGVDQSLGPYELQEVKRYLKNRNFASGESSLGNRWWMLIQKHAMGREVLTAATLTQPEKYVLCETWKTTEAFFCNIYIGLCFQVWHLFWGEKLAICFHAVAL